MSEEKGMVFGECKKKLLEAKSDILNRILDLKKDMMLTAEDRGGDEVDQVHRILSEKFNLTNYQRNLSLLIEIEHALKKIDQGVYGFCEETEEPIEQDRLLSIPWTRLSIEGAELRENVSRLFRKRV